ncbi:HNH endonuclease [Paragemmobacter ruber]|nr:HNH endonuclease signature motif containing protein [Rhodobacter ruber]
MGETFVEMLRRAGLDPKRVKLLRHDARGLAAWLESPDHFLSFASIQSAGNSPFRQNPEQVAHFLPGPRLPGAGFSARFVGVTQLHGRWTWDGLRLPRVWLRDYRIAGEAAEAADQSWLDVLRDEVGRLDVDWGPAPRAWHQRATGSPKRVIGRGTVAEIADWGRDSGPVSPQRGAGHAFAREERRLSRMIAEAPMVMERTFAEFRMGMIRQRPDQGRFRAGLLARHGARCCMTGCAVAEALEAAHIIPFAETERDRDSAANGLLLRRDVHRLFDLGLISVEPEAGAIWVAPDLRASDYGALHGRALQAGVARACLAAHYRRRAGAVQGGAG